MITKEITVKICFSDDGRYCNPKCYAYYCDMYNDSDFCLKYERYLDVRRDDNNYKIDSKRRSECIEEFGE